ncbi:type II toxin-antitoxin system VapC family toxin [Metallosphaera tengchongensis]|uniref:Type II toxin-antitoxin system VapC family toxin n=1 Tax=Metallosphaera tengchongensis TaxID=1532350 RepID=A0A6N0NZ32_9CREN|nr:type II toxin-antitoxin system VapC family toxin [Metallosphaera tengchongensis]QKR00799.1 type II toxin-antitoxin system VapC family toxin [Metallosphaera tengchongensis]
MTSRYFDVNVFVYYLTGDKTNGPKARHWFHVTEEKYTSSITPLLVTVVLSKVLGRPVRDHALAKDVVDAFSSVGVRYLDLPPWDEITETMGKYRLDLEDSIHVATAIKNKLDLVSNDEELKRKVNAVF